MLYVVPDIVVLGDYCCDNVVVTSFLPWPFRCQGTGDEETGGDGLISSCKLESSNFCERVWIWFLFL